MTHHRANRWRDGAKTAFGVNIGSYWRKPWRLPVRLAAVVWLLSLGSDRVEYALLDFGGRCVMRGPT